MLSQQNHIHCMGIGGIGMSAIAKILIQQGYTVSGCDLYADSLYTNELKQLGCQIAPHHQHNICNDPSINYLVYTTDIAKNNPELLQAQKNNITIVHRATMLAEIMRTKFSIAVAGSHGKTTTSALMTHLLQKLDQDPTYIIGGHLQAQKTNASYGKGSLLVAEADESDRSFLQLFKTFSIVTNIDLEHLETYKDFNDVQQTFVQFMNQIPFYGCNVVCLDDAGVASILPHVTTRYITYGQSNFADFKVENIQLENDSSTFDIIDQKNKKTITNITIPLMGLHNVLNTAGTIALAMHLQFDPIKIKQAFASFCGIDRRFTIKGLSKAHQAIIVDDYGHHPEEIRNTILVARKKTNQKLIMVFQPHRHTRTYHLWNDFIKVLSSSDIDQIIITDIFAKGEQPFDGINSQNLVAAIKAHSPTSNPLYFSATNDCQQILHHLQNTLQKGDLVLFQGAGIVNKLAKKLLE